VILHDCIVQVRRLHVVLVENRHNHIGVLCTTAALYLLRLCFFEDVDVLLGGQVILLKLFLDTCFFFQVLLVELLGSANGLVGNQLVGFEFAIDLFLGLMALGQEHFPPLHVVHSFVVVSQQVSLYKWAVSHVNLLLTALAEPFLLEVS